ncbi:MAG: mechanosensitive ion channel family protein [Bacteroidetes bacterium]|nr:mechanosensitive ion channel family protein [Bacteroidota bacterium]
MENLLEEFIQNYLGISPVLQIKLLNTIILIGVLYTIIKLASKFFINKIEDVSNRYLWLKISRYITVFIAFIGLSKIWLGAFDSFGTYLGLLSAGLAIAFKDLLINLVGWLFILIRKPLRLGDRIQIGEVTGDVIDIRIFQFSVMEIGNWVDADQSTGRIIHIPNGFVFSKFQANYTEGFEYIWNEIPVLLTFESDWKKAKTILEEILNKNTIHFSEEAEKQIKRTARKFLIFYNKLSPIVYTTVKDSGVLLTMRFLCEVRKRRGVDMVIWEAVLNEFAKHDNIDFAYPTQRFYNNLAEGKQGTKPLK